MIRRILLPGLSGGLVLVLFALVVNGILGFKASIDMKTITNETEVYDVLKRNVTEAGRYAVNPELNDSERFPEGEPVFSVLYGGVGHEAAGSLALVQIPMFFIPPLLTVWILAHADRKVLSSYRMKTVYFMSIGLLIAIASRMSEFGIGDYPVRDAAALALFDLVAWTTAGTVMSMLVKPLETDVPA